MRIYINRDKDLSPFVETCINAERIGRDFDDFLDKYDLYGSLSDETKLFDYLMDCLPYFVCGNLIEEEEMFRVFSQIENEYDKDKIKFIDVDNEFIKDLDLIRKIIYRFSTSTLYFLTDRKVRDVEIKGKTVLEVIDNILKQLGSSNEWKTTRKDILNSVCCLVLTHFSVQRVKDIVANLNDGGTYKSENDNPFFELLFWIDKIFEFWKDVFMKLFNVYSGHFEKHKRDIKKQGRKEFNLAKEMYDTMLTQVEELKDYRKQLANIISCDVEVVRSIYAKWSTSSGWMFPKLKPIADSSGMVTEDVRSHMLVNWGVYYYSCDEIITIINDNKKKLSDDDYKGLIQKATYYQKKFKECTDECLDMLGEAYGVSLKDKDIVDLGDNLKRYVGNKRITFKKVNK